MIPPFKQWSAFPVTVGMCLVSVVIYLFAGARGADMLVLDIRAFEGEPWRVLSTAFVHGGQWGEDSAYFGLMHLGFNLYWALALGPLLEKRWGHVRLASFVIAAATISSLLEYTFMHTPVGLSGVVYALAGARWYVQKHDPHVAEHLEPRVWQLLGFWFFFCIVLSYAGLLPVANIAHGSGAAMGIAMAAFGMARPATRIAAASGLALSIGAYPLASPKYRPMVNLKSVQGLDAYDLGERAFSIPDYVEAERYLLVCTTYPRCPAVAYYNLGVARARQGKLRAALEGFTRAAQMEPGRPQYARERDELEQFLAHGPTNKAAKHEAMNEAESATPPAP